MQTRISVLSPFCELGMVYIVFDFIIQPFGYARTRRLGPGAQTCPGAAPAAAGQRALRPAGPRVTVTRIRRPAARHGEAGRPRWARPGPTRTHVRLGRLGASKRAGGEEAAARATTSQLGPKPLNVSGQQALQLPPPPTGPQGLKAADVQASLTGGGVVPGSGKGTRQYAIKAWSRAGRADSDLKWRERQHLM